MKRYPGIFLRGLGMGAADAVPGVSGGTIAFITGIYEELIESIKRFGPSAFTALRQGGVNGLAQHLNLGFLVPLLAGIALSLISVAHAVVWLLDNQPLMLNGFFLGLVAASALIVARHPVNWHWWYILPLALGLLLAQGLPVLMPAVNGLGSQALVLLVGGSIAISAMLLPGVSGSFLLLSMGLYDVVMEGLRGFDVPLLAWFATGCILGLVCFSRLLSWLLRRHHGATLQMLLGFIIGSMPVLWPWRELIRYQIGGENQVIPLDYRYLAPWDYTAVTGESAQLLGVTAVAVIGMLLVLAVARLGRTPGDTPGQDNPGAPLADKEKNSDA